MEGVEFDENQGLNSFNTIRQQNSQNKLGLLPRILIKLGLAKDQKQADRLMVIICVICLLLTGYFIISTYFPNLFNFSKPSPVNTYEQQRLDALRNGANPTPGQ